MLYVKKDTETNEILCYGYNPRNRNNKDSNNNDIILEITEDQWKESKYGKYADIVDNQFIIGEITNNNDNSQQSKFGKSYDISSGYISTVCGFLHGTAWNNRELVIYVNGTLYRGGKSYDAGGGYHSAIAGIPCNTGDVITFNGGGLAITPYI